MSGIIVTAEPQQEPVTKPTPIPPRLVTVEPPDGTITLDQELVQIRQEAGILVTAAPEVASQPVEQPRLQAVPFWSALDRLAADTGTRLALADRGRQIRLVKHTGPPIPAAVAGPFRVAVRQVESRRDFETGGHVTLVTLDVHWEPRFPVIRLDGEPSQITVHDDRGSAITASTSSAKVAPQGCLHTATVRLTGVPRAATRLTQLNGAFTVTAAPGVLPFTFADLGKPGPGTLPQKMDAAGVASRLVRFEQLGDRWEAEVTATYPPGHPEFESFESWTANNRARLVGPSGTKVLNPIDYAINEVGRTATGIYRFRVEDVSGGPAGWKLVYETPSALREYPIRFTLRAIPLP